MSAFWICLPLLATGFIVGIVVSLAQILTSIQDPAVGAVPRLVALGGALALTLPWITSRMIAYTTTLWSDFSRYAH
jgi:flagellar biosynthetic protein FliQ